MDLCSIVIDATCEAFLKDSLLPVALESKGQTATSKCKQTREFVPQTRSPGSIVSRTCDISTAKPFCCSF